MVSLIGAHYSRNGIKQFPARVILSMYSNGIGGDETHPDTVVVLRDTRVFPSGEAPPDFHTFDPVASGITWSEYGRYWYSGRTEMTIQPNGTNGFRNFKEAWDAGQPADYYTICNEQGGGEGTTPAEKEEIRRNVQRLCDIERAISKAANADGRKCCVGNFAGGSPGDFQVWKDIVAPFIVEAWQNGGNIYGRHVYSEEFIDAQGNVKPGQPQRVVDELKYLQSIGYGGGVVLTECGIDGGYGVADLARFTYQVQAWEAALRPYSDILIGLCWWECGDTGFHADYTDHLKTLVPYMQNSYLGRWEPAETTQPPDGGGGKPMTQINHNLNGTIGKIAAQNGGTVGPKVLKLRQRKWNSRGWFEDIETINIPLNDECTNINWDIALVETVEDTGNPNPPSVVNPLTQGALVVDVSYSNDVDFAELKENGVQGVIIRASNGIRLTGSSDATGVDVCFWQHLDEAVANGLEWGSYHYCNENYDDFAQVEHFCGIIQSAISEGYPLPSLGLWLDFETPSDPAYAGAPKEEHRIQALCAALMQLRPVACDFGVYTSKSWWDSKVPNAGTWVPALGMKQWVAAWPAESALVNGWPPATWHPSSLKGFTVVNLWQWTSKGGLLVGHNVASIDLNFVGDTAVVPTVKPPDPPTGATVDLLPYFKPSGKHGRYVVFHFSDGRTQPQQMELLADGRTILWKGEGQQIDGKTVNDYEEIKADDSGIRKFKDTSSGGRTAYDLAGVVWLPRFVQVGKVYESKPTVRNFDRVNCQTTATAVTTDYIYVKELLPVWISPINPAIKFYNVLVCEWRKTPDINTPPIEVYKFAIDVLYCEWNNGAVGELPEGRAPLSFQLTNC